jgi:CBS domain-containing protein
VHGVVVVDGTAPVGVFTQTEALAARRLPPLHRPVLVDEGMSYEAVLLEADTPIHRAAAEAVSSNARRIVVCEGGQLAGVLSCVDRVGVLARA